MPVNNPGGGGESDRIMNLPTDSITLEEPIGAYPYGLSVMYTVDVLTENTFAYGDPDTRLPGNGSQGIVITIRVFDEAEEDDFVLQWYTGTAETMMHARQYYPGDGWEPWLKGPYWGDIAYKPEHLASPSTTDGHVLKIVSGVPTWAAP